LITGFFLGCRISEEANAAITDEPLMGGLIHAGILHHGSFECALAYRISMKLASREMSEQILCARGSGGDL